MSLKNLLFGAQNYEKAKTTLKAQIATFKEESGLNRTSDSLIRNTEFDNVLIIKLRSFSIGNIFSAQKDANLYCEDEFLQVLTTEQNKIYSIKIELDVLTNRNIVKVYDERYEHLKIGEIKPWLISPRLPFLEKEAKTCSVILKKENLCYLKKCVSLGQTEYQTIKGNLFVRLVSENLFSIQYEGQEIAKLHALPIKLKNEFVDRYVLEYRDIRDEQIALLAALAIDSIS